MDEYPDTLRLLYLEFGRTAEVAQIMEMEAGNLALSFVSLAFDPSTITDDERGLLRAIVDDVNSRTFGNLLKQIRRIGGVSEGIQLMVDEALEKRNYLVHKFFRSHNLRINSEEGRIEMIADLRAIHESLSRAHAVLAGMTQTLNQAFGRPNISDQEAEELVRRRRRLDI
jgi:hypothetical protein